MRPNGDVPGRRDLGKEGSARHQALSGKKMILLSHLD